MSNWFAAKKLVLNLDKGNTVMFKVANASHWAWRTGYKVKYVQETLSTKFLGLQTDNFLNFKSHIRQTIRK